MVLFLFIVLVGCATNENNENLSKIKASDYSLSENWLSLPAEVEKNVDIFYLSPTTWSKLSSEESNFCEIDNELMRARSTFVFSMQAAAFETAGNIYAPYYRQVDGEYILSFSFEEQEEIIGGIPAIDATAAFDYYIKNYNKGKPFILAGHSQGAHVIQNLLSEYMEENPEVYSRMIAAYVIGVSVTEDYLEENPHLKFAKSANDTGVIISYNTQAPVIEGIHPLIKLGAISINPITWTLDESLATSDMNLGSLILDKDGNSITVQNFADAQVDQERGVLICSTVDASSLPSTFWGKGIYHSFDYSFYYHNIKENALNRIQHYLNK
jgi:pimeloyl-ACP methyl ester carboxylesterase